MKLWNDLFMLEGKTVKLIPLELEQAEGLWQAADDERIWTYMATKISNKQELIQQLEKALEERDAGLEYGFSVYHKERQEIVGSTRYLDISSKNKSAEIGSTWYHPSVWRTAVNTECKYLLLQHAFEVWELNRVFFKTDSRNNRSQQAIARLGAVKEGILRSDKIISDGYVRDSVYFSILQNEWQQVKMSLKQKQKAD